MVDVHKIVLTGGPCGGKSLALRFLKAELERRGVGVFIIDEVASRLMDEGKTPENMGSYGFHSLLFRTQLAEERRMEEAAAKCEKEKAVILCDRGLLDNKAYVTEEEFARYSSECGCSENQILCSYDAVFHMVSAAKGAEAFYTLKNNPNRSESLEQARDRDDALLSVWVGTPHLRVLDNRSDFSDKLRRLLEEMLAVLGIPEPLEIERKFLILYPDIKELEAMKTCRRVHIFQTYMDTPEEGRFRVRQRGEGEQAVYIKTQKRKLTEMKRVEIEKYISKEEYNNYISKKEYTNGSISKDRYCIVWHSAYYELDVFPFWNRFALLEIELLREDQPFELPDFVTVLREVTMEKAFRNKSLALTYGEK